MIVGIDAKIICFSFLLKSYLFFENFIYESCIYIISFSFLSFLASSLLLKLMAFYCLIIITYIIIYNYKYHMLS